MAIGRIPEPGTGIPESIVDAKGDIVTATAADTPARLAVGTNEQRLVADSAAATGLKYVADTTNYAVAAKGDLLVGTAADTVAVLSVGTDGHTLVADSSVSPTGLKWAAPAAGGFVGVKATASSATSLSNNTWTAINFNTEAFDSDGFHSTSTNNSRITIPSGKGGKYLLTAIASFASGSATGSRYAQFYLNGAVINNSFISIGAVGSSQPSGALITTVDLVANDYVELYQLQSTGGTINNEPDWSSFTATFLGA